MCFPRKTHIITQASLSDPQTSMRALPLPLPFLLAVVSCERRQDRECGRRIRDADMEEGHLVAGAAVAFSDARGGEGGGGGGVGGGEEGWEGEG